LNIVREILIDILVIIVGLIIGICIGYYLFMQYQYKGPDSNVICKQIYTDKLWKKIQMNPEHKKCMILYNFI